MFKLTITLLVGLAGVQMAFGQCRDVTLDDCEYGENGPFESSKGLTEALCQRLCNEVYPGRCTFFIYDRKQEVCELFDTVQDDYISTCKKIGGPRGPEIATCPSDPDPCVVSTFKTLGSCFKIILLLWLWFCCQKAKALTKFIFSAIY
jgi:hypothetical protein